MVDGLNVAFRAHGKRSTWQVIKTGIVINDHFIPFEDVEYITITASPKILFGNGIVKFKAKSIDEEIHLLYTFTYGELVPEAVYVANCRINELHGKQIAIDHLCSSTGTLLEVFDDYLIITHIGWGLGVFSDPSAGTKRIDYDQLTAIQYKKPGNIAGYLQFAYPGAIENKGNRASDIIDDENTIPVSSNYVDDADRIYEFIEKRRRELRQASTTRGVVNQISEADELLKFKQLLDMGVITQEEFEAKKKQILGI